MPLLQSKQLDSLLVYRHGGPANLSDLALGKASPCCVCANVIDTEENQEMLGLHNHMCADESCDSRYCCLCYEVFTVDCDSCGKSFCFNECAEFYHGEDGCLCRECAPPHEYSEDESGEFGDGGGFSL